MGIKITHDPQAPTASVELMITRPLPDYDLVEVETAVPREVDPILASQGFKDLLDDARGLLARELQGSRLEIVQLTGAICHAGEAYRPGVWLVVQESGAAAHQPMSGVARERVGAVAETLRSSLKL